MASRYFLTLFSVIPVSDAFLIARPTSGRQPVSFSFNELRTSHSDQDFIENNDDPFEESSSSEGLFFDDFDYQIGEYSRTDRKSVV